MMNIQVEAVLFVVFITSYSTDDAFSIISIYLLLTNNVPLTTEFVCPFSTSLIQRMILTNLIFR